MAGVPGLTLHTPLRSTPINPLYSPPLKIHTAETLAQLGAIREKSGQLAGTLLAPAAGPTAGDGTAVKQGDKQSPAAVQDWTRQVVVTIDKSRDLAVDKTVDRHQGHHQPPEPPGGSDGIPNSQKREGSDGSNIMHTHMSRRPRYPTKGESLMAAYTHDKALRDASLPQLVQKPAEAQMLNFLL